MLFLRQFFFFFKPYFSSSYQIQNLGFLFQNMLFAFLMRFQTGTKYFKKPTVKPSVASVIKKEDLF